MQTPTSLRDPRDRPNAFFFNLRIPGILHVTTRLHWFSRTWFRRRTNP